jgi:hypothetical protein
MLHASVTVRLPCTDPAAAGHARLTLDWATGVAATDWEGVAKKEHLDQLALELRRLEDTIREVREGRTCLHVGKPWRAVQGRSCEVGA